MLACGDRSNSPIALWVGIAIPVDSCMVSRVRSSTNGGIRASEFRIIELLLRLLRVLYERSVSIKLFPNITCM